MVGSQGKLFYLACARKNDSRSKSVETRRLDAIGKGFGLRVHRSAEGKVVGALEGKKLLEYSNKN